jgi:hypothetical protein
MRWKSSLSIFIIITLIIGFSPFQFKTAKAITANAIGLGKVADIRFDGNKITNIINSKTYNAPTGSSFISTPYGSGLQYSTQGVTNYTYVNIPSSDLSIDSSTQYVTANYMVKIPTGTLQASLGLRFMDSNLYTTCYQPNNKSLGFVTAPNSIYGTQNCVTLDTYIMVTTIFKKNDESNSGLYVNGVKQTLGYITGFTNPMDNTQAVFGNNIGITGNNVTMTSVQMWNRALTDTEISQIYNSYTNRSSQEIEQSVEDWESQPNSSTLKSKARGLALSESDATRKSNLEQRTRSIVSNTSTIDSSAVNSVKFNPNNSDNLCQYQTDFYKKRSSETSYYKVGQFPYNGLTGKIAFDTGQAYNIVNSKSYGAGGGVVVDTPYGKGWQANGGQISIPTSDLGISNSNASMTVSFWYNPNSDQAVMPIGLYGYNLYYQNSTLGFNTGNNDNFGTVSASGWNHYVAVFNKNDAHSSKLYVNGVLQPMKPYGTNDSNNNNANFYASALNVSGWSFSTGYRMGNSQIANINVWSRGLSDTEAENVYRNTTGLDIGKSGDFTYAGNKLINLVTGKSYDMISGMSTSDSPYGKGIKFSSFATNSGPTLPIDRGDLSIGDLTKDVSFSFIAKINDYNNGISNGLGFFFGASSSYVNNNNFIGISSGGNINQGASIGSSYNLLTFVIHKNDMSQSAMYINGVKAVLKADPSGTNPLPPIDANLNFDNNLILTGNGSTMTSLKVWNRALNDSDVQDLYKSIGTYKLEDGKELTRTNDTSTHLTTTYFDFSRGFDFSFTARWDELSNSNRPFEFSNNNNADEFLMYNVQGTNNANVYIHNGSKSVNIQIPNCIFEGETSTWRISADAGGNYKFYKNEQLILLGNYILPSSVGRNFNSIGVYYSPNNNNNFKGYIGNVVLSIPADSTSSVSINKDTFVQDTKNTNTITPNVTRQGQKYTLDFNNTDTSDSFSYFAIQTDEFGNQYQSATQTYNRTPSGIRGYAFTVDSNPTTDPSWTINSVDGNFSKVYNTGYYYLHVRSQDANGYWSPVVHYSFEVYPVNTNLSINPLPISNRIDESFGTDDSSQSYTYNLRRRSSVIPINGLTGEISFESNSVKNLVNGKSYTPNGTPIYTLGQANKAYQYNGSQTSIPLSDLNIDDSTSSVSVSFWYRWDGTDEVMPIGFYRYDLAVFGTGWIGFNSSDSDCYGVSGKIPAFTWVYITCVFNKDDYKKNTLYINGVSQSLSDMNTYASYPEFMNFTNNLNIGGWSCDNKFRCVNYSAISNLLIYNRALSSFEANQIYQSDQKGFKEVVTGVSSTTYQDTQATDKGIPSTVSSIVQSETGATVASQSESFTYSDTDSGTNYCYYVSAIGQIDGKGYNSDAVTTTLASGIKEYWYSVDSNPTGTPTGTTKTSSTNLNLTGLNAGNYYLHILGVDYAGNKSTVANSAFSVSPITTLSTSSSSLTFNNVNPLTSNYYKTGAMTLNISANKSYDIKVSGSSLSGATGNTLPIGNLSVKLSSSGSYVPITSTGITLSSSSPYTTGTTVTLDFKLTVPFNVNPDNYSGNINITIQQN